MISPIDNPGGGPEQDPAPIIPNAEGGMQNEEKIPLDTSNRFLVGARPASDTVVITAYHIVLRREEAINLAAWLAAVSDPGGKDFERVLEEIRKS